MHEKKGISTHSLLQGYSGHSMQRVSPVHESLKLHAADALISRHGCRYTSVAALETLGRAYREATQLIEDYYVAFHEETLMAAQGRSPCPEVQGVAVLEKNAIIDRVQQPLSAPILPMDLGLPGPLHHSIHFCCQTILTNNC